MLYSYPINFYDLSEEFEKYIIENPNVKTPLTRYYKIWSRAVSPYVLSDGEIILPDIEDYYYGLKTKQLNAKSNKGY